MKDPLQRLAPLFVIIAASLWGVDGIVLRPSLYTLPVPLVVFIETAIAAIILTPFFIKSFPQLKKLKAKDWLAFVAVAVFGGALGTMAITKALFYVNYVNLSIVILIQKLQPVFAISLAALLLRERLPRTFLWWAGLAIIGAYFMTFGLKKPLLDTGDKTLLAALFAIIATISFASSTVFSKRALRHVQFKMGTYLRFSITAILMLIITTATGDFTSISHITSRQWLIFGLIVISSGAPAIFLYYSGLMRISASVATICELAFPLTGILLEYFVHGKLLSLPQWLGVLVLIVSILQVSKLQSRMEV
ncbi:MAG TPA: DMT family transporter [Caldithrix abyssi]|uniref:DMT family transporter n=1 Tax=Caldithrix abyssi TaxID=187145 RepID=A0A7V5PQ72_CALAY|nr:DMT family transporter [Caldithrix abyssi]